MEADETTKGSFGSLTITERSLIFEDDLRGVIGFDLTSLRLVRLNDVNRVDMFYLVGSEIRKASFTVTPTFPSGKNMETIPEKSDPERASMLRLITGGVVARLLSDSSSSPTLGLTRLSDDEFESKIGALEIHMRNFPTKEEWESGTWTAGSEQESLYDSPRSPEESFDRLWDELQLDWVNGRLSPLQRARTSKIMYDSLRVACTKGLKPLYGDEPSPDQHRIAAERILEMEGRLGIDLLADL